MCVKRRARRMVALASRLDRAAPRAGDRSRYVDASVVPAECADLRRVDRGGVRAPAPWPARRDCARRNRRSAGRSADVPRDAGGLRRALCRLAERSRELRCVWHGVSRRSGLRGRRLRGELPRRTARVRNGCRHRVCEHGDRHRELRRVRQRVPDRTGLLARRVRAPVRDAARHVRRWRRGGRILRGYVRRPSQLWCLRTNVRGRRTVHERVVRAQLLGHTGRVQR